MLAPWKNSYDKPRQHIKKQRQHFTDKGSCDQSYRFSSSLVWMWELDHKESWALKNCCFNKWCWRSNQSVLKEINPEYSLKGLILTLKIQYFGHLMQRTVSLEETLAILKTEGSRSRGNRGWDGWMGSSTQCTGVWKIVKDREAWSAAVHGVAKSRTWLVDWTTAIQCSVCYISIFYMLQNCHCYLHKTSYHLSTYKVLTILLTLFPMLYFTPPQAYLFCNIKSVLFIHPYRFHSSSPKVKSLSRVWLFVISWTVAYQAPWSMGFSRQEYWSGLLFPSPGDLPNPGTEPGSPSLQAGS